MFIRRPILVLLMLCCVGFAQSPVTSLRDVKTIYVADLGQSDEAKQLREKLVTKLTESKLYAVTEQPETADATLTGTSSFSTDRRAVVVDGIGSSQSDYSATVLLKLSGQNKQLLWTSELDGKANSFKDLSSAIADNMVKTLKAALKKGKP